MTLARQRGLDIYTCNPKLNTSPRNPSSGPALWVKGEGYWRSCPPSLELLLTLIGHRIERNGSLQDVKLHLVIVHVQNTHDAVTA